jgi:soluble lytic murein transglycosylase-like protein
MSCFLISSCEVGLAANVCEAEMIRASRENDVPLPVLYAVALTETAQRGELSAYALNVHGRAVFNPTLSAAIDTFDSARRRGEKLIDIGCMQINYFYHGSKFADVRQMFEPAANVDYAARFLRELHRHEGRWTEAVARYHAGPGNAPAQRRYVCAVIRNMLRSGFGASTPEAESFCAQ